MKGLVVAGVFSLLFAAAAHAQNAPIAGIDFREVKPPQAVTAPRGTVEVVQFFWYRCPHCYALEPALESWLAKLPAGVQFKRVPAVFGDHWEIDAQILYALEAIGELKRVHRRLLDAIHEQGGRKLADKAYVKWVAEWLAKDGVDGRRYEEALHSAAVRDKSKRAAELTVAYGVEGTPTFVVDGRYLVKPMPGDRKRLLSVTDYLVQQARKLPATIGKQ